jgi:hypothetical protein
MSKSEVNESEEKKSHKFLNFIIFIIITIICVFLYAKYIGTSGLIVKEYRVKSSILTSNYSGVKIVHFSDLLYKSTVDKKDVHNLVLKINMLKPDIVVFTGNLFTNNVKITEDDIEYIQNELSKIKASIGAYAVYGEYDYNLDNYEEIMSNCGFKVINNSFEEVFYKTEDSIYIVGFPSSIKENINLADSFKFYDELNRKYTIVLLSEGSSIKYLDESYYDVYADVIVSNCTFVDINKKHYVAAACSRRNEDIYALSDSQILAMYENNIKSFGSYPKAISAAMGDRFFFARFETMEEAEDFVKHVLKR